MIGSATCAHVLRPKGQHLSIAVAMGHVMRSVARRLVHMQNVFVMKVGLDQNVRFKVGSTPNAKFDYH